jgi:TatD DNase family protein
MLIDTHAHIYLEQFNEDRTLVVRRAKEANIKPIILPNVDSSTTQSMLELEKSDPCFFHAAIGLHPTSVDTNYQDELEQVKKLLEHHSFCAIGEIGIDLYWDKTQLKEQIEVFEQQLEWAIQYKLPVIIHVRDAFPEALQSVKKLNCPELQGVFHSFGGSLEDAQTILNFDGFKLGINGVVTFKNSNLKETLQHIPLEHIVLETDAPYLSPVPYRGKRNEPKHLKEIV